MAMAMAACPPADSSSDGTGACTLYYVIEGEREKKKLDECLGGITLYNDTSVIGTHIGKREIGHNILSAAGCNSDLLAR